MHIPCLRHKALQLAWVLRTQFKQHDRTNFAYPNIWDDTSQRHKPRCTGANYSARWTVQRDVLAEASFSSTPPLTPSTFLGLGICPSIPKLVAQFVTNHSIGYLRSKVMYRPGKSKTWPPSETLRAIVKTLFLLHVTLSVAESLQPGLAGSIRPVSSATVLGSAGQDLQTTTKCFHTHASCDVPLALSCRALSLNGLVSQSMPDVRFVI